MATVHVVTIRLSPEQYEWIQDQARQCEETLSWVLRDVIDQARREDEEEM